MPLSATFESNDFNIIKDIFILPPFFAGNCGYLEVFSQSENSYACELSLK